MNPTRWLALALLVVAAFHWASGGPEWSHWIAVALAPVMWWIDPICRCLAVLSVRHRIGTNDWVYIKTGEYPRKKEEQAS